MYIATLISLHSRTAVGQLRTKGKYDSVVETGEYQLSNDGSPIDIAYKGR